MLPSNPDEQINNQESSNSEKPTVQSINNQETTNEQSLAEIKLQLFLSQQENDKLQRIIEQKNAEIQHTQSRLRESNTKYDNEVKKHREEINHYKKGIKERDDKFEKREVQVKKKKDDLNRIVAVDAVTTVGECATCCLICWGFKIGREFAISWLLMLHAHLVRYLPPDDSSECVMLISMRII